MIMRLWLHIDDERSDMTIHSIIISKKDKNKKVFRMDDAKQRKIND